MRKQVGLFFQAAHNVTMINTLSGGTAATIEYFNDAYSTTTQASVIAVSSACGMAQSFHAVKNSNLDKTDKLIFLAGALTGEIASATLATLSFTVSGSPHPINTFAITNGMLAVINKIVSAAAFIRMEKETDEHTPILSPQP